MHGALQDVLVRHARLHVADQLLGALHITAPQIVYGQIQAGLRHNVQQAGQHLQRSLAAAKHHQIVAQQFTTKGARAVVIVVVSVDMTDAGRPDGRASHTAHSAAQPIDGRRGRVSIRDHVADEAFGGAPIEKSEAIARL